MGEDKVQARKDDINPQIIEAEKNRIKMQYIKLYRLNIVLLLLCSFLSFGQTNEEIKVEAPSNSLHVVIYSKNRPVVSGYVIINKGEMLNHGVFTIFDVEGNIIQKITYDKGKVVDVETFDPELKS